MILFFPYNLLTDGPVYDRSNYFKFNILASSYRTETNKQAMLYGLAGFTSEPKGQVPLSHWHVERANRKVSRLSVTNMQHPPIHDIKSLATYIYDMKLLARSSHKVGECHRLGCVLHWFSFFPIFFQTRPGWWHLRGVSPAGLCDWSS
jgi:hypothetical protein